MPRKINNIHDKFVKELLSNKEVAVAFFQAYLPEEVVSALNFDTLRHQNTSFLSKQMKASYADMIWQIETSEAETIKLSLLLEHKSYPDSFVAFQMFEYLALGYQTQLKQKQPLELIIPILYYHGQEKFDFKTIKQHFEHLPAFFQAFVPTYETRFINLNKLTQEQIFGLKDGMLRAALMLQQNYFDPLKLGTSIKNILESLNPYLHLNSTDFIFVYLLNSKELNISELEKSLEILPSPISEKVMSIYDQLIQQGIEQGIEKGIEQGIEQGIERGIERGIEKGIERGIEKGIERGFQKSQEKTILNSFDNGLDINTIRLIVGEPLEKIEEILKKNGRI